MALNAPPGLSPRMRGTGLPCFVIVIHKRFIPADAGNGITGLLCTLAASVYPRGCGERSCSPTPSLIAPGLSPRMRGTVRIFITGVNNTRFIPADAGNGRWSMYSHNPTAVYPRGCEDRNIGGPVGNGYGGLSPRKRGTGCVRRVCHWEQTVSPRGFGRR